MRKLLVLFIMILSVSCSRSVRFRLLTSVSTGIDFENRITETDSINAANYEYIYNGAGVGIADLNNDALPDIIFAGNQVSTRIYLNQGNFRFRDITGNFKGLTNDQWYSGVAIADVNNDSLPDIYLTSTAYGDPEKRKNRLWINNGSPIGEDPTFTERAEEYGIADTSHTVAAGFFDYDLDGDLDLYLLNNTLNKRMDAFYRSKVSDGSAPNNDKLYRNNGDRSFTEVTIAAGIIYEGFGLGLAISDLNKDGYPDLYISNDFSTNDILYINQGNGTFRNEISKYISYQSKASMGNDIADVNNDGNPDIYTLDMMPDTYCKRKQANGGFSYLAYIIEDRLGYEHQYVRNMLHLHNGFIKDEMVPFSEVGQMMGISQTNWSWAPLIADFDNDGDKDLMISNGYPRDLIDKDWIRYKSKMEASGMSERELLNVAPVIKIPNDAYENLNTSRFVKRTKEWMPEKTSFSYGAAFSDLDNDGDLDYIVNNVNDKAFIYRNYTVETSKDESHFLKIKLAGTFPNRMAIGAKIELWYDGRYQFSEEFLTRGYASSADPVVHFGLGKCKSVDSLKITWPSAEKVSVLNDIKADRIIKVNEKGSISVKRYPQSSPGKALLFMKSENVLNYIHSQNDYPDFFFNQKVILHKFSQIGPSMAYGDISGDGMADIVIGSTNRAPTTIFVQKSGKFVSKNYPGLSFIKDASEADLAVTDINHDGLNDIIAIAGGLENQEVNDFRHYVYYNQDNTFIRKELPIPPFPASVVRICDFNHDGFQDLFVGSRVKKGQYPYADKSWIVINKKGELSVEPWSGFELGMVTDAVWTDFDNDGWEDLIITREWNTIVIIKNMDGKEMSVISKKENEKFSGFWYSIACGDFDKNGFTDYIVGNLGESHRFNVSNEYPLKIYATDIDLDGILDPIMSGFWPDFKNRMTEYPVNYLDELKEQSSFFGKKFANYRDFSYATINEIIDTSLGQKALLKLLVNTTSSYVIWNDGGKFTWEKLPAGMQISPLNRMVVKDLNHDGFPDVIASGNDYTYDVSSGFYDASKGLIMISRGTGRSFDILPPSRSGFLLQGMISSLLSFEMDSDLFVIAGVNRKKALTFTLNNNYKYEYQLFTGQKK